MKIISVINYKGGVGKTTLTANIGALLASRGYRVLLIDLDPQASLTFSFFRPDAWITGLAENRTIKRWYDEFSAGAGDTELADLIVTPSANEYIGHSTGRIDLIASHLGLINVDLDLAGEMAGLGISLVRTRARYLEIYGRLANGLASSSFPKYDFVLIDCPPNFNIVTQTAIVASNHLLVPSRADDLSTLGIQFLIEKTYELVHNYNEYIEALKNAGGLSTIEPTLLGVIFTMVQMYRGLPTSTNQFFINRTAEELKVPTFSSVTRLNQRLYADASYKGIPLAISRSVWDEVAAEFSALADEFLAKINMKGS